MYSSSSAPMNLWVGEMYTPVYVDFISTVHAACAKLFMLPVQSGLIRYYCMYLLWPFPQCPDLNLSPSPRRWFPTSTRYGGYAYRGRRRKPLLPTQGLPTWHRPSLPRESISGHSYSRVAAWRKQKR